MMTRSEKKELIREIEQKAEGGDADAQYYLGLMYAGGLVVHQDYARAFNWYSNAAEQGHAEASKALQTLTPKRQGMLSRLFGGHGK
jgi:TPR repeat protein